jgi:hypothetical protein
MQSVLSLNLNPFTTSLSLDSPVPAASHGPKRHKRQATIAILFLIILAGVAIFCLFAKYCCSTSGEKAQEIKDLFSGIGEKLEDMQEIFD